MGSIKVLTRARLNNIGFHRQAKIIGFKILTPWKKLSTIKCSPKVNKYLLQLTEISRG